MPDILFNVNDCVKVKLNEWGKQLYINTMGVAPHVSKDGYTVFQLHQLMRIYGEHMIKAIPPFDTNILIIKKER